MKQCPYCNAQIADDSKFCGECGKEYPQDNVCPKCGATVNEGDIYCEICGRNLKNGSYVSSDDGKSGIDYMKILLSSLLGIIVGIVILAVIGGSWYGCNEYAAYKERAAAREKFVTDSLEQVRKDSIKIVERKEQERINAEKFAEFREKFTFGNLLALLKNHDNASYAQKCGLNLIYKDIDDAEVSCEEYVYGYDVEKGENNRVEAKSNYSCYLRYSLDSSTHAAMYFKNASDADYFQNIAKEYGLLVYDGSKYVPQKKISSGYHNVDSLDWEGDYAPTYMISDTSSENGWYIIHIGIDF